MLEILDREDFPGQAAEKGDYLLGRLRATLGDHPHVGEIRGKGLMCAVEFVEDRRTKTEFPTDDKMGPRIYAETQRRGLFSRMRGDIFLLAPPIVITTDELDRTVEILAESVRAVLG
jgi:adenosylmethionine-8-amino-7-oxononanoate aminotransferase